MHASDWILICLTIVATAFVAASPVIFRVRHG